MCISCLYLQIKSKAEHADHIHTDTRRRADPINSRFVVSLRAQYIHRICWRNSISHLCTPKTITRLTQVYRRNLAEQTSDTTVRWPPKTKPKKKKPTRTATLAHQSFERIKSQLKRKRHFYVVRIRSRVEWFRCKRYLVFIVLLISYDIKYNRTQQSTPVAQQRASGSICVIAYIFFFSFFCFCECVCVCINRRIRWCFKWVYSTSPVNWHRYEEIICGHNSRIYRIIANSRSWLYRRSHQQRRPYHILEISQHNLVNISQLIIIIIR